MVLPQLRASSLKHVIYNHSVLIIRDVTLQPAESTMQLELMLGAKNNPFVTAICFSFFEFSFQILCDSFQRRKGAFHFFQLMKHDEPESIKWLDSFHN